MASRQCTHIKADGIRCGSPALRGRSLCYFHHHPPDHRPKRQVRAVDVRFPEDATAVQVSLYNVMVAIIDRRIGERRASQLLWALQIASSECALLPLNNAILQPRTVRQQPAKADG